MASLAIGLIVGFERGWSARGQAEGARLAGVRTFALAALAGGTAGLLALRVSPLIAPALVLAVGALLWIGHHEAAARDPDIGLTTEVALLLTALMGMLPPLGETVVGAALAVITSLVLRFKRPLHAWVGSLEEREVYSILQLLTISLVVLPLLPDAGFGPGGTLNPFRLWLLVVIVAAISFAGHVTSRIVGPARGAIVSGMVGGLISSTAVTLACARRAASEPPNASALAIGAIAAHAVLPFRLLAVAFVASGTLFELLVLPLSVAAAATFVMIGVSSRRLDPGPAAIHTPLAVDLVAALQLAALVAVIQLASAWVRREFGDVSVLPIAALAGLVDVDPVVLSLGTMVDAGFSGRLAVIGLALALSANAGVKLVFAGLHGGRLFLMRAAMGIMLLPLVLGLYLATWR